MPGKSSVEKIYAWRYLKLSAIVVCSLILFSVTVLNSPSTAEDFKNNTLDHSWIISLAAALQQGEISGRDFYYTYGVLSQVLARAAVALNPDDSALYSFFSILLIFRSASIVLLGLLLGLIKQVNWKQTLFIFLALALLNALFHYAAFREMLVLLCAVLLQRTLSAPCVRAQRMWAVLTGGVCLAAQLFTVELGPQTIFSSVIVLLTYAVFARFRVNTNRGDLWPFWRYLAIMGIIGGTWLVGNLVVSLAFKLSSPRYAGLFDYQRYSLEIIRGYNNTMGTAWRPPWSLLLGFALIVFYAAGFVLRNLGRLKTADGYLLFSFLVSSLIALRGMTLRSDWQHVTLAFIPFIFLLLLLGQDWSQTNRIRHMWVGAMLILFATWPGADFSTLVQMRRLVSGELSLSDKLHQIVHYQSPLDALMPAGLTEASPDPSRPMLNFPYQNYIAIGMGRKIVAPVLQTLIAHTEALQWAYVKNLESQKHNLDVVYGLDSVVSWPVDNVQNISRVPVIFEYLYCNFELQSPQAFDQGYYLLRPRSEPVTLQGEQISYATEKPDDTQVVIWLEQPATCSLVRLNVKVNYPITRWLGRPEPLALRFLADGVEQMQSNLVAIETGRVFTTYVSLVDPSEFYRIFGNGSVSARQWDELQITPYPTGPFGVPPSVFEVSKIECINFSERQQ